MAQIRIKMEKIGITADAVVLRDRGPRRELLLVRRGIEPFKGSWALPGGFLDYKETLEECAVREVAEETGLDVKPVELIGVYSKPDRDPRGHTVSAAFLCELKGHAETETTAGDDASEAKWWPLGKLPRLAFDHSDILRDALP